jgi:hypothetical protein
LAIPVICKKRAVTVGKEEVLQEDEVKAGTAPPVDYL